MEFQVQQTLPLVRPINTLEGYGISESGLKKAPPRILTRFFHSVENMQHLPRGVAEVLTPADLSGVHFPIIEVKGDISKYIPEKPENFVDELNPNDRRELFHRVIPYLIRKSWKYDGFPKFVSQFERPPGNYPRLLRPRLDTVNDQDVYKFLVEIFDKPLRYPYHNADREGEKDYYDPNGSLEERFSRMDYIRPILAHFEEIQNS